MIRAFDIGFPTWETDQAQLVDVESTSLNLLHQNDIAGHSVSTSDSFSSCFLTTECEITSNAMDEEGITNLQVPL